MNNSIEQINATILSWMRVLLLLDWVFHVLHLPRRLCIAKRVILSASDCRQMICYEGKAKCYENGNEISTTYAFIFTCSVIDPQLNLSARQLRLHRYGTCALACVSNDLVHAHSFDDHIGFSNIRTFRWNERRSSLNWYLFRREKRHGKWFQVVIQEESPSDLEDILMSMSFWTQFWR